MNVLLSVCINAITGVSDVRVDIPAEPWEGERALMTCTFRLLDNNDHTFRVYWYKGNDINFVYLYKRTSRKGKAVRGLIGRADGTLDEDTDKPNITHKLYINPTKVTDEDTYKCNIYGITNQKTLTVNGEYSLNLLNHLLMPVSKVCHCIIMK